MGPHVVSRLETGTQSVALSSMPGMGLPEEIWFYILSFLWRHPSALVACMKTRQGWGYPCREMLKPLQAVFVRNKTDLLDLAREIVEIPELRKWITTLYIYPSLPSRELLSTIPLILPSKLPNLSFLSVTGHPATTIHPSSWVLLSAFHTIVRLDLEKILLHSFADLTRVVCSFPNLSTFIADDIDWTTQGVIVQRPRRAQLDELFLRVYKGNPRFIIELMEWLPHFSDIGGLKFLQLHLRKTYDYSRIQSLFQQYKYPSLQSLQIEMLPKTLSTSFSSRLSLRSIFRGSYSMY